MLHNNIHLLLFCTVYNLLSLYFPFYLPLQRESFSQEPVVPYITTSLSFFHTTDHSHNLIVNRHTVYCTINQHPP